MKKFLIAIVALMPMTAAQAQSVKEQIEASQNAIAELKGLLENNPKESGAAEVDAFMEATNGVASQAIQNSSKLKALYDKMVGANADVLNDLENDVKNVKAGIEKEVSDMTGCKEKAETAAKAVADLTSELASASALAKVKVAKKLKASTSVLNHTKDVSTLLLQETTRQASIAGTLLSAITSGIGL